MSKFNVGDKIRIKTTGRTGKIRAEFTSQDAWWNLAECGKDYIIELDDGTGTLTLAEKVLEKYSPEDKKAGGCECGAFVTDFPEHHSTWCPLHRSN